LRDLSQARKCLCLCAVVDGKAGYAAHHLDAVAAVGVAAGGSGQNPGSIVETALAELSRLGDEAMERVLRTSSFAWNDLKEGARPVAVFVLLPVNKLESHKPLLTLCTVRRSWA
jgi:type IV secretory pathway TraG/TraD family ATPase VirD4